MRHFTLAVLGILLFTSSNAFAWHTEKHELLSDAVEVLEDMRDSPDQSIPTKLIKKAKAIIVIPTLLKGGFLFGARYGEGVATVRNPYTGKWGPPSFITTAGASFGFQAGAQAIDLVLLVMSERGIKGLLKDKFTLGGDIALTAGPVGRYAEAGTDILIQGEIYSYSRSKGLFGGVSLKGTVIQPNEKKNRSYYGKGHTADQILMGGKLKRIPKTAIEFVDNMNRIAAPPIHPSPNQMQVETKVEEAPVMTPKKVSTPRAATHSSEELPANTPQPSGTPLW